MMMGKVKTIIYFNINNLYINIVLITTIILILVYLCYTVVLNSMLSLFFDLHIEYEYSLLQ